MKWFDITDEAKNQMEKLLAKHPDKYAISLSVLGGGCAGFKYDWGFIDKKEDVGAYDEVVDWHTGKLVVDETSMMYVAGTKIDWKEEVFGSQFEIINPNAKSGCGCGESFGV
jgi:iron-sulfur cluster assembly accessory protein|tara:strand:+ start:226 stop:561 length:336 start_codon:yes stop_codon:yes gene_type:complete